MMPTAELVPIESEIARAILENPESFVTGLVAAGVLRRSYHAWPAERKTVARVELLGKCEGPPGHAHGGLLASLLDEVMAVALLEERKVAMTGRLKVDYLKPCPFPASYRIEAWIQESDPISALLQARLFGSDGAEMASASARFIWVD
jgi:acyl-coenzyme A thioesterase PaaI-like protein